MKDITFGVVLLVLVAWGIYLSASRPLYYYDGRTMHRFYLWKTP